MTRHVLTALLGCLVFASGAHAQLKVATAPVEAPYSLTAADGTGLLLTGLEARAVVDGPLAFTELHLTFRNPQPRQIEGRFQVTMPDGAAMSRFAMLIDGRWMEGEVVEKQAARRAYEDALHRRQDPALLEQDSGNTFTARVFPIPANGTKELIVSWSHNLVRADEAYRLPLLGLPTIDRLSLTALVATPTASGGPASSLGGQVSRYRSTNVDRRNFKPDQDWVVFGGELPKAGDALRADNLSVVRFAVPGQNERASFSTMVIAVDTSASRAVDFNGRLDRLSQLVAHLPELGVKQLEVLAFDQSAEWVFKGAPADFAKAREALARREPLGASDLSLALSTIAKSSGGDRRVLFVTDGMITAGDDQLEGIKRRTDELGAHGISRVDVLVDTTARDNRVLEALVQSKLANPGKVVEGRDPLDAQLSRLSKRTLADVSLSVPGAEWVWPQTARGLQAGDVLVVFADVPGTAKLEVKLAGGVTSTIAPQIRKAEKPLLERAWIAARIDRLLSLSSNGDKDMAQALVQQIINLSTKHRVLSPYTALVVLETEADYARFNISRNALSDILVVGATGVELMHRAQAVTTPPPPPPPPPVRIAAEKKSADRPMARAANGHGGAPAGAAAEIDDLMVDQAAAAPADKAEEEESAKEVAEAPAPSGPAAQTAAPAPLAEPMPAERAPQFEMARGDSDEATGAAGMAMDARRRAPSRPASIAALAVDRRPEPTGETQGRAELREIERGQPALTGKMAQVKKALASKKIDQALSLARAWRAEDPADLLGALALGQALAAKGDMARAARAFGSVVDLYPSRADMRRLAGNWLEQVGDTGLLMAADTYAKAAASRPDHPSVYHQLAMVLVRLGRYDEAMTVVLEGIKARRANERFAEVERILAEDAQLIAAAWLAVEPGKKELIQARLSAAGLSIDQTPSMRFVLTWETDANDVDFHIFDSRLNHAFYSRRELASGGSLYADITTGYGPECFTVFNPKSYPYLLKAHYYSRGPMGYGAGKVQVIRHDGKGHLGIQDRPFLIMQDGAFVDLGKIVPTDAKPVALPKAR